MVSSTHIPIQKLDLAVYKVPAETPEADGTLTWDSTTMVFVKVWAADEPGIGYTYAPMATASVIYSKLRPLVAEKNALDIPLIHHQMVAAIRNSGNCGVAMMAVSAVDNALWDLKARLLHLPLCELIGSVREGMPVYGSGGFTNYTDEQMTGQLAGWIDDGIKSVKIKIGTHPARDPHRVRVAREAIGEGPGLFVDANGALKVKEALQLMTVCEAERIQWFEEPVTSDNLRGLRFIKEQLPLVNIAAGEYGYNLPYFQQMLQSGAVDVLQADATRCGGITNFLRAGALAQACQIPFSSHCAPSLHLHPAVSLPGFYIAEYFFDHVRIEKMFFDGFHAPSDGKMQPDRQRAGLGLELKEQDVRKFLI